MQRIRFLTVLATIAALLLWSAPQAKAGTLAADEGKHDHRNPVEITITPNNYPALNELATIKWSVEAAWDMANVQAQITLPAYATLTKGELQWTGALQAHQPLEFEATFKPQQTGTYEVRGTVKATESKDVVWSDVAYSYLHVEQTAGRAGIAPFAKDPARVQVGQAARGSAPVLEEQLDSTINPADQLLSPPALAPNNGTRNPVQAAPAAPQGTLVVAGRWMYHNRAGNLVPQNNLLVQLVRGDNNAHIAFSYADWNGYYTFPGISNPGAAGVKVRVFTYVKWAPNNYELMVVVPNGSSWSNAYWGETGRYVFGDGNNDVGTWWINPAASTPNAKAWWGVTDLITAFFYTPTQPGGAVIEWSPTSTDGTYYSPGEHIHLAGGDMDDVPHTVYHEYGHNIMNNVYGFFPTNDCVSPHYINRYGGTNCGWTEGWGDFFAISVANDTTYRWPGGGTLNLESATWFNANWDDGAAVEGRVAGTLRDIADYANDGYDQYGEGFGNIWATFTAQSDNTFGEFWSAWVSRGHNLRTFRAAAYQNTIDYGYAPRLSLTWGATPADLDLHAWLPASNSSHIYYGNRGSLGAAPWSYLDVDDRDGYGPENITIARPFAGTYAIAASALGSNIANTGARVDYYLGPYWVSGWSVPTSGTGTWWHFANIDGATGNISYVNQVLASSPAPYRPLPGTTEKTTK